MSFELINTRGLVMIGCGNMGSALLKGWINEGLLLGSITIIDPRPSVFIQELSTQGLTLNQMPSSPPSVVVLAVKPYQIADVLEQWKSEIFNQTVFLSIAAGASLEKLESLLSSNHPVVRSMPNTPASVLNGATAYIGNVYAKPYLAIVDTLLSSVGLAVELEHESQMNAVTALSGSGPAYIFQLAESMAAAGEQLGLPKELAMSLAKQTLLGASQMMVQTRVCPAELRKNVTSPAGTTQAALDILKDSETGFDPLLMKAMQAAHDRSIELG